jgi:hypothetical protein
MPLNYMFYKCGEGNCWLPLAEQHGFYVGFSNLLQPNEAAQDRYDRHPIGIRAPEENFRRLTGYDDDCIAWLTHENNRNRLLLITFDQRHLTFWQATGSVAINYPGHPAFEAARAHWQAGPSAYPDPKAYKGYTDIFRDGATNAMFKTLPVTKLGSVQRSELYTSIDSLRVYSFLNRGTCRPLWPISGTGTGHVVDAITQRRQQFVRWNGDDETSFGVFVRLYLNAVLRRTLDNRWPDGWANEEQLGNVLLQEEERLKLTLHTFNPILVETAALYFCLDLGLIGDIGTGKGIDVIDIRARAESLEVARTAADSLECLRQRGVTAGIAAGSVIGRLREERVLELQCKAADRAIGRNDILYFGYGGGQAGAAISVSDLGSVINVEPWHHGYLGRFVNMQKSILFS